LFVSANKLSSATSRDATGKYCPATPQQRTCQMMLSFRWFIYRCVLTTIDPATGIKDPDLEPLRTLRKYVLTTLTFVPRRCVLFVCTTILSFVLFSPLVVSLSCFSFCAFEYRYRLAEDPVLRRAIGESPLLGINLSLEQSGRIRIGDVVYVGQL
jgi:hypothetical protein